VLNKPFKQMNQWDQSL